MKTNIHYRQGDVMIERISALPPGLKRSENELGKVILAHGEVTGHHHAFSATHAEKYTSDDGAEFFNVVGEKMSITLPIVRKWNNQVMVNHPKHGLVEFYIGDVAINGNDAIVTGDFGVLKHDEHTAHGIPSGIYKGAGMKGTVRQREYSPSEIRRVAD